MPKRINQLTDEQQAAIPGWNAETIRQILSLEPVNMPQFVKALYQCCDYAKLPHPFVVLAASPLEAWGVFSRYSEKVTREATGAATREAIRMATWEATREAAGEATGAATWEATRMATRMATREATRMATWAATREATGAATWAATREATGAATEAATWEATPINYDYWSGGREWLSYIRWFLFLKEVCHLDLGEKWAPGLAYYAMMREAGSCILHSRELVVVSQPPMRREMIQWNGRYLLHCDGKAAVEYRDGFRFFYLNGVAMPRWVVETSAKDLDVAQGLALTNAEQRREFVRKVGVERIYQQAGGTTLDRQGDYELITLNLHDKRQRPYLKMRNPSIGVWHLEGVPPSIKTVQQAINWRAGDVTQPWNPEVLT